MFFVYLVVTVKGEKKFGNHHRGVEHNRGECGGYKRKEKQSWQGCMYRKIPPPPGGMLPNVILEKKNVRGGSKKRRKCGEKSRKNLRGN
jgi:hypothetical protein